MSTSNYYSHPYALGVMLVVTLSILLRAVYLNDGLPFRYEIDENNRMYTIERMLSEKSLNPHWFGHPAQTVIYPVSALISSTYLVGRLIDRFSSTSDFADWYHNDPSFVYMLARGFMLLVSLAVVLLTMRLSRKLYGNRTALMAGTILALSPLHIYASPLVRSSDIVMSMFLLLCTFQMLNILQKTGSTQKHNNSPAIFYALGGVFVGLSVTSKYYGVFAAVGIMIAHILVFGITPLKYKYLFIALGFSLLAAFMAGPYLFLDFSEVMRFVASESRSHHLGATAPGFSEDMLWFVSITSEDGIGPVFTLLAGVGIVASLRSNWRQTVVVLAAPLSILVFLAALKLRWPRWTLAFLPFLAIYASFAVDLLLTRLDQRFLSSRKTLVKFVFVFGVFSWSLVAASNLFIERQKADARNLAYHWINENIPAGSRLFIETYGPQLDRNNYSMLRLDVDGPKIIDQESRGFIYYEPRNRYGSVESLDMLQQLGVKYVVLTNWEDRMRKSRFTKRYEKKLEKYDELRKEATLLLDTTISFKNTRSLPFADARGESLQIYALPAVFNHKKSIK